MFSAWTPVRRRRTTMLCWGRCDRIRHLISFERIWKARLNPNIVWFCVDGGLLQKQLALHTPMWQMFRAGAASSNNQNSPWQGSKHPTEYPWKSANLKLCSSNLCIGPLSHIWAWNTKSQTVSMGGGSCKHRIRSGHCTAGSVLDQNGSNWLQQPLRSKWPSSELHSSIGETKIDQVGPFGSAKRNVATRDHTRALQHWCASCGPLPRTAKTEMTRHSSGSNWIFIIGAPTEIDVLYYTFIVAPQAVVHTALETGFGRAKFSECDEPRLSDIWPIFTWNLGGKGRQFIINFEVGGCNVFGAIGLKYQLGCQCLKQLRCPTLPRTAKFVGQANSSRFLKHVLWEEHTYWVNGARFNVCVDFHGATNHSHWSCNHQDHCSRLQQNVYILPSSFPVCLLLLWIAWHCWRCVCGLLFYCVFVPCHCDLWEPAVCHNENVVFETRRSLCFWRSAFKRWWVQFYAC